MHLNAITRDVYESERDNAIYFLTEEKRQINEIGIALTKCTQGLSSTKR